MHEDESTKHHHQSQQRKVELEDGLTPAGFADDPLHGLVDRALNNPSVAFDDDVLAALRDLRENDLPAYEALIRALKHAGTRISKLEAAVDGRSTRFRGSNGGWPAGDVANLLDEIKFFRTEDGVAYADIAIHHRADNDGPDHRETWRVDSPAFRDFLVQSCYEGLGALPPNEDVSSAINLSLARAKFDGPVRPVFVRVGRHEDTLFLDLGDPRWRAVSITHAEWEVVDEPAVHFVRPAGYLSLPEPRRGGSIDLLRKYLNLDDQAFVLAVFWLLAALKPEGPYPILVLTGEQGSAKSTFTRLMRLLVDPNKVPLRSVPSVERDLLIAAVNSSVLAFDNLSALSSALSDALCRLSTGGGIAARRLYTDQDETLLAATRPIILNGIQDFVVRSDLADRCLFLTLQPIADSARRSESDLMTAFEADRPLILGALLDAVLHGLQNLPTTHLERLPRMADFARWSTACETQFWEKGTFMAAYERNRSTAVDNVIEADPVASALCAMMSENTEWTGTATDLLTALQKFADDTARRHRSWPTAAAHLSNRLRRIKTVLRTLGIEIEDWRDGHARTRMIRIKRTGPLTGSNE